MENVTESGVTEEKLVINTRKCIKRRCATWTSQLWSSISHADFVHTVIPSISKCICELIWSKQCCISGIRLWCARRRKLSNFTIARSFLCKFPERFPSVSPKIFCGEENKTFISHRRVSSFCSTESVAFSSQFSFSLARFALPSKVNDARKRSATRKRAMQLASRSPHSCHANADFLSLV